MRHADESNLRCLHRQRQHASSVVVAKEVQQPLTLRAAVVRATAGRESHLAGGRAFLRCVSRRPLRRLLPRFGLDASHQNTIGDALRSGLQRASPLLVLRSTQSVSPRGHRLAGVGRAAAVARLPLAPQARQARTGSAAQRGAPAATRQRGAPNAVPTIASTRAFSSLPLPAWKSSHLPQQCSPAIKFGPKLKPRI